MAHAWRFADILRHFPIIEIDGKLWVDIEGRRLSRDDVLERWATYCDEAGNSAADEQSKTDAAGSAVDPPSKQDILLVLSQKKPPRKRNSRKRK